LCRFTNYYDVQVGIDAFELLTALGYKVLVIDHEEKVEGLLSLKAFLKKLNL
jgi:Fe-S oxidoreductase